MSIELISEDHYSDYMNETVLPYLEARKHSGFIERNPGESVYYETFRADHPKASVVIIHGFSSSLPKFYETAWYFLRENMNVFLLQQRGHGLSFRGVSDRSLIWISDYKDLILDLRHFMETIVKPANKENLPLYLFCHSMGGAVGACYLEHYPSDFSKAVLSAPMLQMDSGKIPMFAAYLLTGTMIRLMKAKSPMPGSAPFQEKPDFENSAAGSRARYEWYFNLQKAHPEYQMCVTPYGTAMQLFRLSQEAMRKDNIPLIRAKVLLFQAEHDTFVRPEAQYRFIESVSSGEIRRVVGSKHEIYRSDNKILQPYWDRIVEFLGE